MDLQGKFKNVCQEDNLVSFINLIQERNPTWTIDQTGAFVRAYAPPKICSYIGEHALTWGINWDDPVNKSYQAFFDACIVGDTQKLENMINEGLDYHQYNPDFIYMAVENNQLEAAHLLINNQSKKICDPYLLHTYVEQHFQVEPEFELTEEYREKTIQAKDVIRFLLKYGYELNDIRHTKSQYGNIVVSRETVLDIAYYWQRAGNHELGDLIEFLRESGAKTLAELEDGLLPWKPMLRPHD